MQFLLFLLDNLAHYLQPAAFFPDLEAVPIYQVLSLVCLAVSFQAVMGKISPKALVEQPITLCALLILFAAPLANLAHFDLFGARKAANDYSKILVYYLLMVTLLNTPKRLRFFLLFFVGIGMVLTILPLLQHLGVIDVEALMALQERDYDLNTFEEHIVTRLRTIGVFNDPNDFCLLLATTMVLCAYWLTDSQTRLTKPLFLVSIFVCCYALVLTQSRGGFLALMVGGWVFLGTRFGWKKAIVLCTPAIPVLLLFLGGRQTSIDLGADEGSGQSRVLLWREGLNLFLDSPLFGVGIGEYLDQAGQVAHNTFLHCLAEMGIVGGSLYLGMFIYALRTLYRLGDKRVEILDPQMKRLRPYVFAIMAAYSTGLLSLSRHFVVPTYMILGLVSSYLSLARTAQPLPRARFTLGMWLKWLGFSVVYLIGMTIVVRLFAK